MESTPGPPTSRPYSPPSSSSLNPRPSSPSIADPHFNWLDGIPSADDPLLAPSPVSTMLSRNPYPLQTLESCLSALTLDNYAGNSLPYQHINASSPSPSPSLFGANVPPASRFKYPLRNATPFHHPPLPDHDYFYASYLPAAGFRNFTGSSSSDGGHVGSSRSLRDTCGLMDCSCQYNSSSAEQYLYQRHHQQQQISRQKFTPIIHNKYPNGFTDAGMNNRRHQHRTSNNNNNNNYKLEIDSSSSINLMNLRGNVVDWAKDQNGCRMLQAKFREPNPEEIEMVLSEVLDHVPELMNHSFGNYLIQKLIEVCDEEQRSRLLVSIIRDSRQLIYICFDNHGTRAVQKLLEKLTSPQQIYSFMLALAPGVVDLIKDMNGHHVIQHCLKNFSAQQNKYLLHEVAEHCFDIATDKSGCCVLQQCVDNSEGEAREHLLFKIIADALQLAEDRYGNYVLQHVLEMNDPQLNTRIVYQLKGSFVQLSCNKFASHVVEKCLTKTNMELAQTIIYELLRSHKAQELLLDPYGNFIIQASLSASQGVIYNTLRRLIQGNISPMRTNMFGRKILEWFDRNGRQLV